MKFDDATLAQIRAADPTASTWVSANAGSGKTRVLTDRVARLLLGGTDPQKILCLTYTKAAAAEMQNRLFERLGKWAMMPEPALRQALEELGEEPSALGHENLRLARTLFANALETPGGLKIQTIHSFCDKLLRRFPLEAGVSPVFEVMEERQATLLREEVLEELADYKAPAEVDALALYMGGMEPDILLREIVSKRKSVCQPVIAETFGVSDNDTLQALWGQVMTPDNVSMLQQAVEVFATGSVTDTKNAQKLATALARTNPNEVLQILEGVCLFKNSKIHGKNAAKQQRVMTDKLRKSHPALCADMAVFTQLIEATRNERIGILSFARAKALANFSRAFLIEYDRRKAMTGKLDFDDLIAKAGLLLGNSASAQWVLYKLDGGIDHILVDEAQDTSPAQWAVISQLADEFTSGQGASDIERTLFVVGDEKQSIYSFQGADPAEFSKMRKRFADRYTQISKRLERQELLHSFRSSNTILSLVDRVFEGEAGSGLEGNIRHRAFFADKPGRVDLWPFVETEQTKDETPWFEPVDLPSPNDPRTILANQVADWIEYVADANMILPGSKPERPITPGDILILVQTRGPLFHAIIKALKTRSVAVAGADRLDVGQELAVRDIVSLLKFADLPEDDLSLAEALRSPIFGWTEDQLFRLAHGRKGSLWQEMRQASDEHSDTLEILRKLLQQTNFLRPYELIEMILTEFKGRERLLARLGNEVEDGINELLTQALGYEHVDVPTLSGFLHWFESGNVEIKREMAPDADQVRVMTVHGAKGLESPVVILPDTAKRQYRDRDQIVVLDDGSPVWKVDKPNATEAQLQAMEKRKEFELQERMRLLYVAITRAESWLVVCGAGTLGKESESWYDLVRQGMEPLAVQETPSPLVDGEKTLLWKWSDTSLPPQEAQDSPPLKAPDWAKSPASPLARPVQPLSPSKMEGAKALFGNGPQISEADALRHGRQIHKLLEHLPAIAQDAWKAQATTLLTGDCLPKNPDELPQVLSEATQVLNTPAFASFFGEETLAEVGITAFLPELSNQQIDGVIDRLIIKENSVLAIDFKTNRIVPTSVEKTPLGILRQMGAYESALRQIYPNKKIELAILWTQNAQLMEIPTEMAHSALQSVSSP